MSADVRSTWTNFNKSLSFFLFLHFSLFFMQNAKHLQCCTGGSRRTTTAPTDYASRCISESHFHSVGNIRLSSSWALIVYGKERCAYLTHIINSFPYRQTRLHRISLFFSSTIPPRSQLTIIGDSNRSVYSLWRRSRRRDEAPHFHFCMCVYLLEARRWYGKLYRDVNVLRSFLSL